MTIPAVSSVETVNASTTSNRSDTVGLPAELGLPPALAGRVTEALCRPALQQPDWSDPARVAAVHRALRLMPPLVTAAAVDRLSHELAAVARGEALLLQGGDCAETFDGNTRDHLAGNVGVLTDVGRVMHDRTGLPMVTVARMAGQYAKPRSLPTDPSGLPSYRGDLVNSLVATRAARLADPQRMLRAYADATSVLHRLRERGARAGQAGGEMFVGHEALLLDYESALLRPRRDGAGVFGSSGHFLWIGERTRGPEGAHVAFAELVGNPVGIKLGPQARPQEVLGYLDRLDPGRTPGRLTLIVRMGADRVRQGLPRLLDAVAASGHPVVWLCDPMHGNTETAPSAHKTRRLDRIVEELDGYAEAHRAAGTHPGGVHLELTGDDVTDCVGGGVGESELPHRYRTACDPRLNRDQALELAHVAGAVFGAALRPRGPVL